MSERLCLMCLERAVRIAMFLREATVHSYERNFRVAESAVEFAKMDLDRMVRYGCLDRETYDRIIRDIQAYLPRGVEEEEEIERLQREFSDKVYYYTMVLIKKKVLDLCEVRE